MKRKMDFSHDLDLEKNEEEMKRKRDCSHDLEENEAKCDDVKGPLAIMWDIDNCCIPSGLSPEIVADNTRKYLRRHGIKAPIARFSAYGNFSNRPSGWSESCQYSGIDLIQVSNCKKDAADKVILLDMLLFAMDNPPPSSILLISGDVDFAAALHKLGQRGHSVFVSATFLSQTSYALLSAARFVWEWPQMASNGRFQKMPHENQPLCKRFKPNEYKMDLVSGSQLPQTNYKRKKRERRSWSLEEEMALLHILEEMVNKGQRYENGTFKSGALLIAEKQLETKFPGCGLRANPHIESKMKVWKARYNMISDMLAKSGFGWNDTLKCVEVDSNDVWDSYVQAHKEANGWRGKPFPMYEKFSIVFGKDRANGKGAEGPRDNDANVEETSVDLGLEDLDIATSVNQATSRPSVTPTSDRSSRKRFKSGNSLIGGLNEMAATFASLVEKTCERMDKVVERLGHAKDFNDDQRRVAKELEEMGFPSMDKIKAVRIIVRHAENVQLFWSFNREDKESFVRVLLSEE